MPIYSPGVKPRDMHEPLRSSIGIGPKGDDGEKGDQGDPGFSPTVSTGDHVITITDVNGPHVYELPTYADEEAARAAAETARQDAEQARQAAETVRRNNETNREFRERQRDDAEGTRQASENVREYREGRRQSFESIRRSDETTRQSNETARRQAEQARVNAEQQRVAADEARDQAEAQRAADWEQIKVEVDARGTAEAARQQAEQERVSNEVARQQTEAARNSAEQARRQAESSRDSAEQVRMQHEQDRSRAENARNIAESTRSNAELERESSWQTMSENVDDAIAAANDAASDIREAAERGDFDGAPGETGPIGPAGVDGFSPTVDVQEITGGHEVTITDADGAHSFDVMDGDPAEPGSITDAMLAPDGIKPQVAQLWGNQLTGTLSGTIATASDAYGAPPMDLTVDGNSTQDGTPTPDAPVPIRSVSGKNLLPDTVYQLAEDRNAIVAGANFRAMWCKVEPNTKYTISRSVAKGNRFGVYTTETEPSVGVALTLIKSPLTGVDVLSFTFTTQSDARYVFVYLANDGMDVSDSDMQLERGSVATPYVPYGNIALEVAGKNLLDVFNDPSNPRKNTSAAGNGNQPFQYDSTNDAYYTGNYSIVPLVVPVDGTYTLTMTAKKSATTGNYFYYLNGYVLSSVLTNEYAQYSKTFTATAGETLTLTIYNTAYVQNIQLELGSTATAYEPYQGRSVPLYDGDLRSLPDGTKDELHLSYLKPSKDHEGWAWYDREVMRRVGHVADMGELAWNTFTYSGTLLMYANIADMIEAQGGITTFLCSGYVAQVSKPVVQLMTIPDLSCSPRNTYKEVYVKDSNYTDAGAFKAAVADMKLDYPLATTITTTLDPIELPELPAPNCTVWCDGGSAQPTYQMKYVQDTNLVIADLRAALADLATS